MNKPVVLLTGGQKGIGFGIAKVLANAGYPLAICSSSAVNNDNVQKALTTLPATVRYYQHDLRNLSAIGSLLDVINKDLGPVGHLIANAGVAAKIRGDMLNISEDNFDFVMDINLKGNFFLAQEVVKRILGHKDKNYHSIVFITSVSSAMISIERAEYCISKAASSMMSQLFATRLANEGIGVFEIRPGIIATDMTVCVKDKYDQLISDGLVPAKRWGQPKDVAQILLPMLNGDMSFATGTTISIDGGLSINRLIRGE